MKISSLFEQEYFENLTENDSTKKQEKIKKTWTIGAIVVGSIFGALFLLWLIADIMTWRKSSPGYGSLKYLTSSTSPNFDLTYTPNL